VVLGTIVVVGLTQGWLHSSPVVLPRALQIGAPPTAAAPAPDPQPVPVVPTTTGPQAADGTVVAAARPVLSEQAGRDSSVATVPPVPSAVVAPVFVPAATDPSGGNTDVLASPPTTTTTSTPAATTTTTVHWGTTTTTEVGSGIDR